MKQALNTPVRAALTIQTLRLYPLLGVSHRRNIPSALLAVKPTNHPQHSELVATIAAEKSPFRPGGDLKRCMNTLTDRLMNDHRHSMVVTVR